MNQTKEAEKLQWEELFAEDLKVRELLKQHLLLTGTKILRRKR